MGQIKMKNRKSKDEILVTNQSTDGKNRLSLSRRAWQMYLPIGFIGLLIAVTLWYAMSTGTRIAKQYSPLVNAVMEIKLEATTAHLWFEEFIGGDRDIDINEVWNHIDQAEWYAQVMLEGGQSDEGTYIPLRDPKLRQSILEVLEKIKAFRGIAKERYANSDKSSVGSDSDQRFEAVFRSFLKQADDVKTTLQQAMGRDIQRFRSVQSALIVVCFILTGIIGVRLHRFERRQSFNLSRLKASNQQLKASEQQLKAANQQLRASEQQQKAINQQLRASDQQLKASNLQLRQSQQKLALHVQQTPLGVIQWDLNFKVTEWNRAAEKIFGFTSEEAIGRHAAGLIVPESVKEIVDEIWQGLLDQKGGNRSTNENNTKDNKSIMCDWYNTPLIDNNGKTIGVASLVLDITERKRAEEALAESEKRFKNIAESMADWIWEVDSKGVYTYVSSNVESILGYRADEVLGKTPFDLMTPKEAERVGQLFQLIGANNEPIHDLENWNLTKDGRSVCLLTNGVPLFDNQGNLIGYRGVDKDITETKRLQALESRAERLELAGMIAGQVAHDFNNLLGPVMAYPEFIHDELPHDHKAHAYLDAIENAARKMANINQDLLTMGRRGHYNQEVLDLNRVVLQAAQEMESRTKTVTFDMNLCEDLMKIMGGGAQIHRMLTNLLVNAQDAMGDIGKVIIKTENYYADDTSIAFGRVPKGEYVKLTVSDNGCGIPDDIIQKILDPFFSTKMADKKRGSGLGLSVVDAVMKDHNGYLDLSSKVGHGTSFYHYFPVTREDAGKNEFAHLAGGTEKVLVVDDDDVQREVSMQLLTKLGYRVSSVESGEKAIELLRENPQDLVILDMVMPSGIDGAETYRQILEINPHQKAIIVSGFSESDRVLEAQKLGAGAFVKKPLTRNDIAAAVRTELDRPVQTSKS